MITRAEIQTAIWLAAMMVPSSPRSVTGAGRQVLPRRHVGISKRGASSWPQAASNAIQRWQAHPPRPTIVASGWRLIASSDNPPGRQPVRLAIARFRE